MNVDNVYLKWIKNTIFKHHLVKRPYNELIAKLHTTVFTPDDKDICRYNDGISVRIHFCEKRKQYQTVEFMTSKPCSLLELILGMAFKLKVQTESPENPNQTEFWFWTMLENMGLLQYDDNNYDENAVDKIIFDFNNRAYSSDGHGSLFYIPKEMLPPNVDMTSMDIWSQSILYMSIFMPSDPL